MSQETKNCKKCGESKPRTIEFFVVRNANRDGLSCWCRICFNSYVKFKRTETPEAAAAHVAAVCRRQKERRLSDPEFVKAQNDYCRDWKRRVRLDPAKNEKVLAADRVWRKKNWDRVKKYKHKTGALASHHAMKRYADQLRATPAWANMFLIERHYIEAHKLSDSTSVPHDVDHIVPLRGRGVCGLHVDYNLRPMPSIDNKRKSNKLLHELLGA